MNQDFSIQSQMNEITITGAIPKDGFRRILAAIHNATERLKYPDLCLNFAPCTRAYPLQMLAICSQIRDLKARGIDVSLDLPNDSRLAKLFLNTNWAHLISPEEFGPSTFKGYTSVPACVFKTGDDQYAAVSRVMDVLMSAMEDFSSGHRKAIEWSLNELTDNVINHSESRMGGIVQLSQLSKSKRAVQFVIADAGLGIPTTIRSGHPEIPSDQEALDRAIREGVTRGIEHGQGNGLYGSWRVCEYSNGEFEIHSQYAHLLSHPKIGLHVRRDAIPISGSVVSATIRCDAPFRIEDALRFKGKGWDPVDFVELNYEVDEGENILFDLSSESSGFGTRIAGLAVRNKLKNILSAEICNKIVIDFSSVPLVSSSYADEAFGKLFVELGPIEFSSRFEFQKLDPTVKALIDRSVQQRSATGL